MGIVETGVMDRYYSAQTYSPDKFSCHSAAYFLLGIIVPEKSPNIRDGCFIDKRFFKKVEKIDSADLIAFEHLGRGGEVCLYHLAVVHPYNRSLVIHRERRFIFKPNVPKNFFGWILSGCKLTDNAIKIEPLKQVVERWSDLTIGLYILNPDFLAENQLS